MSLPRSHDLPVKVYSRLKESIDQFPVLKARLKPIYHFLSADRKYDRWIKNHVRERRPKYSDVVIPKGQFSILTTAWNTPANFLRILGESLKNLDGFENVEWVLLNNGSSDPETLAELEKLRQLPNVRYLSVSKNVGIIPGMRMCLEHATGRYVLPVDSDDELYQDSLKVLQHTILGANSPALLYSDEDKISNGIRRDPYMKPDWDPVLFYHSCYIAHLCAIDRNLALKLGAYSNPATNGCHDWDTFSRFHLAGHKPVHVPEVLYSWRIHHGSTAGNIQSKDYLYSSHRTVLGQFVESQNASSEIEVQLSPLFDGTPDWQFKKTTVQKHSWSIVTWGHIPLRETCQKIVDNQDLADFVILAHEDVPFTTSCLPNLECFFQLFPDTAAISGRIVNDKDQILIGDLRVVDGAINNEYRGYHRFQYGYFAQALKPHSTDAASPLLSAWRKQDLKEISSLFLASNSFESAVAQFTKSRRRVIFDPLFESRIESSKQIVTAGCCPL